MFFVKFLVLISIAHSLIFSSSSSSSSNSDDIHICCTPEGISFKIPHTVEVKVDVDIVDIVDSDESMVVTICGNSLEALPAKSNKSLPRTTSGILAFLTSEDPSEQDLLMEAKRFIDAAYALKEAYKSDIRSKKDKIERIARETLRYCFQWGSISTSNLQYPWSFPEKAQVLIKGGLEYYNLVLEIKSLMDDGRLNDEFLKKGVDRAKLREGLEEALVSCGGLLEEIYPLQEKLDAIRSGPLPSPKHVSNNTPCDYF